MLTYRKFHLLYGPRWRPAVHAGRPCTVRGGFAFPSFFSGVALASASVHCLSKNGVSLHSFDLPLTALESNCFHCALWLGHAGQ